MILKVSVQSSEPEKAKEELNELLQKATLSTKSCLIEYWEYDEIHGI